MEDSYLSQVCRNLNTQLQQNKTEIKLLLEPLLEYLDESNTVKRIRYTLYILIFSVLSLIFTVFYALRQLKGNLN